MLIINKLFRIFTVDNYLKLKTKMENLIKKLIELSRMICDYGNEIELHGWTLLTNSLRVYYADENRNTWAVELGESPKAFKYSDYCNKVEFNATFSVKDLAKIYNHCKSEFDIIKSENESNTRSIAERNKIERIALLESELNRLKVESI